MIDDGILYRTFEEADRLRRASLADGNSREDANAIVTNALREAWPKGRDEPWRYTCETCSDTGWRLFQCGGDSMCGRQNAHAAHGYVEPCVSCAKGVSMIPKQKTEVSELETVGRGKSRKPTRPWHQG